MSEHHARAAGTPAGAAGPPDEYVEAEIHRMLAEDPDVAEQGITVVLTERGLVLYGEVESPHRREEILRRVAERFPDVPISSDIGVIRTQAPTQIEQLP
ncbi:hypothetical protein GCM10010429_02960 [Micromonospora olivasterospora]|uniref:BON domain-containing protein n=2 Tax=Micromonospora olivasterospora TaxID=1880 RepID=A0A562I679_MICOL|nr:hypothetical protein JD77_01156 [Micromonospora olivasterospora]